MSIRVKRPIPTFDIPPIRCGPKCSVTKCSECFGCLFSHCRCYPKRKVPCLESSACDCVTLDRCELCLGCRNKSYSHCRCLMHEMDDAECSCDRRPDTRFEDLKKRRVDICYKMHIPSRERKYGKNIGDVKESPLFYNVALYRRSFWKKNDRKLYPAGTTLQSEPLNRNRDSYMERIERNYRAPKISLRKSYVFPSEKIDRIHELCKQHIGALQSRCM